MKETFTTNQGTTVSDDQNSLAVSNNGPVIIQDVHLIEKLAHFNRERIPERIVHAKGAGAGGYFELTKDVSKYTKAKFLSKLANAPKFLRGFPPWAEKKDPRTLNAIQEDSQ